MFNRTPYTEEEFILAVKSNQTIAGILKQLNLQLTGGNYNHCWHRINKLNIPINHFHLNRQGWSKGKLLYSYIDENKDKIFCANSFYRHPSKLKKYLIEFNILEYKCEACGNTGIWMNKPLILEIDHINGIPNDNRLENLRILCLNCHSQTPTFRRNNKQKPESKVCLCGEKLTDAKRNCFICAPPSNYRSRKKDYFCMDCKIRLTRNRKRCLKCHQNTFKKKR